MRKTPAVTSVDECTRADTGVGAAIAAGSQEENGIWALFVIAANKIISPTNFWWSNQGKKASTVQWPWDKDSLIAMRIRTSPIRFVRAVNIPDLRAFGVW